MSHNPTEDLTDEIPLRVLIVEDDPASSDALSQLLEISGFDVRVAGDADEAIRAVRTNAPDVVLTDIDLGEVGGCELARTLIQNEGFQGKIAALTGGTGAVHDAEIRQAGIDKKFSKPIDLAELKDFLFKLRARSS